MSAGGSLLMKPTVSETSERAAARQRHAPRRGIERRERLVGDKHRRARERIEQRRLADVRVADERREEEPVALAREAAALALLLDLGEPRLEIDDAVAG